MRGITTPPLRILRKKRFWDPCLGLRDSPEPGFVPFSSMNQTARPMSFMTRWPSRGVPNWFGVRLRLWYRSYAQFLRDIHSQGGWNWKGRKCEFSFSEKLRSHDEIEGKRSLWEGWEGPGPIFSVFVTLPETNSKSIWKWMVGIFSKAFKTGSFRECIHFHDYWMIGMIYFPCECICVVFWCQKSARVPKESPFGLVGDSH